MLHAIFNIVGVFLIIIGIVEIVEIIARTIIRTRKDTSIMVLPIKGHSEDVEYLLRSAAVKVKYMRGLNKPKVICLDCGMDEETRKICTLISNDYKFMEVKTLSEFEAMVKDI